jgi:hypothetical protein
MVSELVQCDTVGIVDVGCKAQLPPCLHPWEAEVSGHRGQRIALRELDGGTNLLTLGNALTGDKSDSNCA